MQSAQVQVTRNSKNRREHRRLVTVGFDCSAESGNATLNVAPPSGPFLGPKPATMCFNDRARDCKPDSHTCFFVVTKASKIRSGSSTPGRYLSPQRRVGVILPPRLATSLPMSKLPDRSHVSRVPWQGKVRYRSMHLSQLRIALPFPTLFVPPLSRGNSNSRIPAHHKKGVGNFRTWGKRMMLCLTLGMVIKVGRVTIPLLTNQECSRSRSGAVENHFGHFGEQRSSQKKTIESGWHRGKFALLYVTKPMFLPLVEA